MSDDGGWDEFADGWEDDPAAIAYSEAAFGSLVEVLVDRPRPFEGARILDFGCGTGLLTQQLVDRVAAIDATDRSPAMLDVLRAKCERGGETNVRMLGELPPAGSNDLIMASSVYSFLDDYPSAVRRLASLLSAGGTFVQWDWEPDPVDEEPHGLTRVAVSEALTSAGLNEVAVETAFEARVGDLEMAPIIGVGSRPTR